MFGALTNVVCELDGTLASTGVTWYRKPPIASIIGLESKARAALLPPLAPKQERSRRSLGKNKPQALEKTAEPEIGAASGYDAGVGGAAYPSERDVISITGRSFSGKRS
jgi:hypothetical protein